MRKLTLVVDNNDSIKHQVLKNLMECDGKLVSPLHAIRNIKNYTDGTEALNSLTEDGLVERRELGPNRLALYRYCSELAFYRRLNNIKPHELTF